MQRRNLKQHIHKPPQYEVNLVMILALQSYQKGITEQALWVALESQINKLKALNRNMPWGNTIPHTHTYSSD